MPLPNTPCQTSASLSAAASFLRALWVRYQCERAAAPVTTSAAALVAAVLATLLQPSQVFAMQDTEHACGHIRLVTASDPETNNTSTNATAARVLSDIDQLILQTGFKCSVEKATATIPLQADSTVPSFSSAIAFDPPELSTNTANTEQPSLRSINSNPLPDAGPGWWINADAVEKHPELVTVLDVLEHPQLFAISGPGLFVGCPAESDCQHINTNLFRAFQMQEKGWQLITPANRAELDASMRQTVEQGQNWFGHYHAPAAVMAQLDLIRLEFGIEFAGAKNWNGCITQPVEECADPRPTGWQPSTIHTVINEPMADSAPREVLTYLSSRVIPVPVMASLLAEADRGENTNMAELFIRQHRELWSQWVADGIADHVAEAVAPLH
jgi:glycine betaine/proline transport system substrate-binding protein